MAAFFFAVAVRAEAPSPEVVWTPAQAADASDRAYEPMAIHLIDHAASSIVLAMYYLKEGEDDRHPVNRLLNDLREAARRGVRVEVYLNTKFAGKATAVLDTPWITRLRADGVKVTGFTASRRWHGKLLIVDERYVLEGSANWSVEALKSNGESNTLMDSPPLARQKLARVRAWGVPLPGPVVETPVTPPAPGTVLVPTVWLARGGVMPQMVTRDDERGFDVLMLLLRRAAVEGTLEFSVDFVQLGIESGVTTERGTIRIRVEILKVLRRLQRRYAVVTVRVNYGREAWVTLTLPAGPTVEAPGRWTDPDRITRRSSEAGYLELLGAAIRQHEQLDLNTLTLAELSARTGLSISVLGRARQELEQN
ncbi:MAG: hypothetical protein HYZ73_03475 [Elusimicrobia bacterium]|nr:hypothetical protein [Elusimicrobiota bacterium]